jgi:hypothetical protein
MEQGLPAAGGLSQVCHRTCTALTSDRPAPLPASPATTSSSSAPSCIERGVGVQQRSTMRQLHIWRQMLAGQNSSWNPRVQPKPTVLSDEMQQV